MQDDATVWLLQFSNTWMHLGFPLRACAGGLCELGTWAGGRVVGWRPCDSVGSGSDSLDSAASC